MSPLSIESYILGLDLGPNSVGWATLKAEPDEDRSRLKPVGILGAGSRVFEAGVQGTDADIQKGRDEPKGQQRRQARLARRGLDRRGRRLMVLYLRLADAGLLPRIEHDPRGVARSRPRATSRRHARLASARARDAALKELDAQLWAKWSARLTPAGATRDERLRLGQILPYALRTHALGEKLEPHEIGRALYHLGQRRGFLSNRKAPKKKDDERSVVKEAIGGLRKAMEETKSRTLGEYLFRADPFKLRIRQRYTARDLYQDEFELIWTRQTGEHPAMLTDALKKRIYDAIFKQRPLKNQKFLVGFCELESKSRRAPAACLEFQRFRLLQQVNHTRLVSPDGRSRALTPEERKSLIEALDRDGPLSFSQAKTLLKPFDVSARWKFNFEEGGESKFQGNRTAATLRRVFGERWDGFPAEQKDALVADLLSIQREETLVRRAKRVWGLDGQAAQDFAAIELEDGHAGLSRKALRNLLPFLEAGKTYAEAREAAYGPPPQRRPLPFLPPLKHAAKQKLMPEVRNPAVTRTLTEMRKVVNALIRWHGLPATIRVELGRDLKNPRDKRERIWLENRKREKERQAAAEKFHKELGNAQPKRSDIEKILLWEECGGQCPYTGQTIGMGALFGDHPQFDIEHIVPYSVCLDDSFLNKTLCEVTENRNHKRNRTPWEAYGSDSRRWDEILVRVKAFKGDARAKKLERFQTRDTSGMLADFTSRQLNDTRYAARLAREYLGLLYGGVADAGGTSRVQVAQGRITADLRGSLRLGSILRDGGVEQKRDDHRHHAVDAVAVALTDSKTVQTMAKLAEARALEMRRWIGQLPAPWEGFIEQVRTSIEAVKVSHRPSRKVSGRLHEDTIYSPPKKAPSGKEYVHVRKPVASLSAKDIANDDLIVDPRVRDAVRAKLEAVGGDPKKLEADPPGLPTRHGTTVPIYSVRIRRPASVVAIGAESHPRHVASDANHHAEIVEVTDSKGRVKWEGHVVSLMEAYRRRRAGEPIVKKDHGPGKRFLFTLAPTDTVAVELPEKGTGLYQVRSIWMQGGGFRLRYAPVNDARQAAVITKSLTANGINPQPMIEPLRKLNCRKVTITPLGEVRYAND